MNRQFITDDLGNKLAVILPIDDYEKLLEDLEEAEDIKLYDEVKSRDEESIPFSEYLKKRRENSNA